MKNKINQWLSVWREAAELENKIKMIVDGGSFCMFFNFDGKLFGTGEAGRIAFARAKNGEWTEPYFTATDVSKLMKGEREDVFFDKNDYKKIEIISDADKIKERIRAGA